MTQSYEGFAVSFRRAGAVGNKVTMRSNIACLKVIVKDEMTATGGKGQVEGEKEGGEWRGEEWGGRILPLSSSFSSHASCLLSLLLEGLLRNPLQESSECLSLIPSHLISLHSSGMLSTPDIYGPKP